MRVPGLLILLLLLLAVQAVFLKEAFSANGYIQTANSPSEAFSANSYIQTAGGSPSEAFGSSQGGAQVQLMASRPAYYMASVPA
jgi:hypothetical protein